MLTLTQIQEKILEYQEKHGQSPALMYLAPETLKHVVKNKQEYLCDKLNIYLPIIIAGTTAYADFSLGLDDIHFTNYNFEYGPVIRLSRVCHILESWAKAYITASTLPADNPLMTEERKRFAEAWTIIWLAVKKSNALARMFFEEESLRKEPCPVHKGHWSGCIWQDPECKTEKYPYGCLSGSNVTGWLPNVIELPHPDKEEIHE